MTNKKGKIDAREMKGEQCIDWMNSVFKTAALGSTEEVVYPEVLHRLKQILKDQDSKIRKQEPVIDLALEKLTKKDVVVITKLLLE